MSRREERTGVDHNFRGSVSHPQKSRLTMILQSEVTLSDYAIEKCGTYNCFCILIIAYAFCLLMVVVGSIYTKSCPARYQIPLYLIVGGLTSSILITTRFVVGVRQSSYLALGWIFSICFFIIGCTWIFTLTKIETKEDSGSYCDPLFYDIAYYVTLTQCLLIAVGIVGLCIICYI
ncbi:hypothetical protein FQR65_LT06052 [Abscondita terminalis]|nr:hypothetical protein FQR65_LT06052 [Abscondita terminalis]